MKLLRLLQPLQSPRQPPNTGISGEAVPAPDLDDTGMRRHRRASAACGARVRAAESLVGFIPLFGGVAVPVLQLTQTPIMRKPLQLPSGSLFRTISTWPRTCFASPPADPTYDTLK